MYLGFLLIFTGVSLHLNFLVGLRYVSDTGKCMFYLEIWQVHSFACFFLNFIIIIIILLYNIVLVLPYINMKLPQVLIF